MSLAMLVSGATGNCSGSTNPLAQLSRGYKATAQLQDQFAPLNYSATSGFRQLPSTPSTAEQLDHAFFATPRIDHSVGNDLHALRSSLAQPRFDTRAPQAPTFVRQHNDNSWAGIFVLQEQQSIWKGKGSMADSAIALEEPSVGVHLAERQMVGWKGGARMCEMQGGMGVRDGLMYSSRAVHHHSIPHHFRSDSPQSLTSSSSSDVALEATAEDWEAAFSVANSRAATPELVRDRVTGFAPRGEVLASPTLTLEQSSSVLPVSHLSDLSTGASSSSAAVAAESAAITTSSSHLALAQSHLTSALRSQTLERDPAAIASLQSALALDPTLGEAHLALGISLANERRWEEAVTAWERWVGCLGLRRELDGPGTRGEWVSGRGDGLGVGEVEWLSRSSSPSSSFLETSRYATIVDRFHADQAAAERLGGLAARSVDERSSELVRVLVEMAQLGGEGTFDAEVQMGLGVLLNAQGEYGKAADCFAAALVVRPEDPLLFNRLGAALANQNETSFAIHYYSEALRINPNFVRARYNLSMAEMTMERHREAVSELLTCIMIQQDEREMEAIVEAVGSAPTAPPLPQRLTSHTLWNSLASAFATLRRIDLARLAGVEDMNGLLAALPAGW